MRSGGGKALSEIKFRNLTFCRVTGSSERWQAQIAQKFPLELLEVEIFSSFLSLSALNCSLS